MGNPQPGPEFEYTVDGNPLATSEHILTSRQIMGVANIDQDTHYLTLIEGRHQVSYKDRLDEAIQMHNHMTFISTSTGPTPVS